MDGQLMRDFRDLWVEHGDRIMSWPEPAQQRLAIAIYESDERLPGDHSQNWMSDAISEMLAKRADRGRIIADLKEGLVTGRRLETCIDLSAMFIAGLTVYPLSWAQDELDKLIPDFIGWRNENAVRLNADSLNDAAAVS